MAKRPEEEQPQAMNAMDQTTQSPDPINGAAPTLSSGAQEAANLEAASATRQQESEQFFTESVRADQPEYMQESNARADAFMRGEGTGQTLPTGPRQTPEEAMLEIAEQDRRRRTAQEEQSRSNAMATERARMARGLPAMDENARRAVEGGGEAMRAFGTGVQPSATGMAAPQAAQTTPPTQQAPVAGARTTTGATQPQQATSGGYETGQTVQLTGMPSGHESTTVYALDNGVALPGGMDMSTDDFGAAFKQINPGKTKMDAVQSLAREPGPTGAAARKLLRDAGATGGQPLNAAQREQVESQLGGRADELLMSHARSMESGIAQGSRSIAKRQEEELKLQEERMKQETADRSKAIERAEKRWQTEESSGRSWESVLQEELDYQRQVGAFTRGEGEAPSRARDIESYDVSTYEARPAEVPGGLKQGFSYAENGTLEYLGGDLRKSLPAVLVESEATKAGGEVVPVVQNDREESALPPGQGYVRDGKYHPGRRSPGRPSSTGEAATGATTGEVGRKKPVAGEAAQQDIMDQFVKIRNDLETEREKSLERDNPGLFAEISDARKRVEVNPADEVARQNLADAEKRLQAIKDEAGPITQDQILAKYQEAEQFAAASAETAGQILFESGDQQMFDYRQRANIGQYDDYQLSATPSGTILKIGDQSVPVQMVGDTPVVRPTSPEQVLAIESSAQGNVFSASMGTDTQTIVASDVFARTTQYRDQLREIAKETPFIQSAETAKQVATVARDYVRSKYPNIQGTDFDGAVDAVLEAVGFSTEPQSSGPNAARSAEVARSAEEADARIRKARGELAQQRAAENYRDTGDSETERRQPINTADAIGQTLNRLFGLD